MTDGSGQEDAPRPEAKPTNSETFLHRHGFRLNGWQVEPRRNRIVSDDSERRLDPRVMAVLVHLATRAGEVVTRNELSDAIWHDTYVSDNTVSQAVSRLRKALGDDTHRPRFIETISKSGYRLLVEIQSNGTSSTTLDAEKIDRLAPVESNAAPGRSSWSRLVVTCALVAVAIAAGVVGSRIWMGQSAPQSTITQVVPELTLVGNQFEPMLSPQGDRLAFCWRSDPQLPWSVWIREVGGDNPVRLTEDTSNERLPAWSPDGRSIAYVRFPDGDAPGGIYRTSILEASTERLGDATPGMRSLHWSSDGGMLAMSVGDEDGSPWRIEVLDLESGMTRVLTTPPAGSIGDHSPKFAPNGGRIAFERRLSHARHHVMTIDARVGRESQLTHDAWGQLRGVDWRADGEAVIYSSNRSGQFALWQVPARGGAPTRVPIHDTWVTQPSVSRDGARLIYRTFRDVVDIWALPLDAHGVVAGEAVKRMPSTRSERHPAWSPGGDAIAFLSDRSGSTELWSGRPDGTQLRRHTDFVGPIPGSPTWSPDGARLMFDAAVDGHSDLWIAATESHAPVRLTHDTSEERNATFSRDGRWIYFATDRSGEWQVCRMPSAGGDATPVTEAGGFLAHESTDGEHLYFAKLNEPGIRRMPATGGPAELVVADLALADWGSWTVGETGIYFVRRNPTAIEFVRFADGAIERVFTPERQMPFLGRALCLSPDGRSLLFTMIDHSDDEVMRVELAGL